VSSTDINAERFTQGIYNVNFELNNYLTEIEGKRNHNTSYLYQLVGIEAFQ